MSLRTEKLRLHALNGDYPYRSAEGYYFFSESYVNNRTDSEILRQGIAKGYELEHCTPLIDDGELIVGKPNPRPLTAGEAEKAAGLYNPVMNGRYPVNGQESHMAVDYEKLLTKGINGILSEIEYRRSSLVPAGPDTTEKEFFYSACEASLKGLISLSDKYSALAAEKAGNETDTVRKTELERIAAVTAKVPAGPAESFYEACQSVSFLTAHLGGLYQLGRPDRYLLPYYEHDMRKGILSREEALEIIACMSIIMNEYMPKGLAVGLMVGGRDENGVDITNDLTYLFTEAIALTRLAYPGVGLCVDKDTPEDLLLLACRLLGKGYSHPAIFNDEIITEGLMLRGLPREHACLYIHSTCVEITPVKRSAVWVASPYHNLSQYLLNIMADKNAVYDTFESLLDAYRKELAAHIRTEVINQNRLMAQRKRYYVNPLVSCFVDDCIAKGLDIEQGGAVYNWIMPSFVGMANLIDSLIAIKKLVFEQKRLSITEFYEILRNNYSGNKNLRAEILNMPEKYGNNCDEPDSLVSVINSFIVGETSGYTNPKGGQYVPSLFCWVMHERFGSVTMATPDGRTAGFPFGDGSGAAQGRDRKGPTASVLSTTKWDHRPFIGGIALNLRFSKKLFTEESIPKMAALIRTYLSRGGFEMQINVVDRDTMRAAQENPEAYGDLIVRIGGYSDYFVRVEKNMQDELILREEHTV